MAKDYRELYKEDVDFALLAQQDAEFKKQYGPADI